MSWIVTVAQGLLSIKAIAGYVDEAIRALVAWYIMTQTNETLAEIADAAAFAARATNETERYAAAEKWRVALSRPRISA